MSNPNSLDLWRARLEHFRQEEAKTSDPARRFEIQQEIQQATAKIAELEALTPTLASSSLANSPSVDRLRLASQLASLASDIAALHNVPAQLDQLLTHFMQHGVGIQAQFIPQPFPPPDEPPTPPLGFIPRTALVQELLTQLTHVTWLNLTGAAGMGKTFAARLLAEHYGLTQTLWISLRSEHVPEGLARLLDLHLLRIASPSAGVDLVQTYHLGGLPFSQLTRYTAHRLAATHLLVIDDIPDLLAFPQLRSKLSELARAVQEVGGKLLTTAQRSLPTAMTAPLDFSVADYPLPFMTPEDIAAMLTRMGAPPSLHHPGYLALLHTCTQGHPSLVAATLAFLRRQGWLSPAEQLIAILTGEPIGAIREETRRQIFQLLPHEPLRELLYRLSVITGPFDMGLVYAVAAVDPPVPRPGELLPELTGPWLHALATDRFEVSPLLSNAGQATLDPLVQRRVHSAVAWHHLQQRPLDQHQAFQIILHLMGAQDWGTLTTFLCQLASQLTEKAYAEAFALITWLFPHAWPDDIPLSHRILFRAAQIRVLGLLEQDTLPFVAELDTMLPEVEGQDSLAAILALWLVGPFNPTAAPSTAAHRALQACRLYRRLPAEIQQTFPQRPLEALVWVRLPAIRTHDDIRGILDVLATMTEAERRAAFSDAQLGDTPWLLVDQCFAWEAMKPDQEQDWQEVLSLVDTVLQVGQLPGGRPLLKLAGRVKALILADYMGQPEEGLTLLAEALIDADSQERFLLHYTAACILSDHSTPEAALSRYQSALAELPTTHVFLHFDALRRAAEAAGKLGQWQLARNLILRSLALIRTVGRGYEPLEMLGELAWAYWSLGNHAKACRALAVLTRRLVQKQDVEDPRFREVLGKTGHALGWLVSLVKLGRPALHTLDGQLYTEPFPGLFSRSRPLIGEALPLCPFSMLLLQLGWFTSGCGLYDMAWRSLCKAKYMAQLGGVDALSCTVAYLVDLDLAELAARKERYAEALSLTLSSLRILQTTQGVAAPGDPIFPSSQSQLEEHWHALSTAQRQAGQRILYWTTIGPAIGRLLAKEASPDAYGTLVTELSTLVQQCEYDFVDLQYWVRSLRELHIAFSPLAIRETVSEQIRNCPASEFELLLLLHLALSHTQNVTLTEACGAQIIVFEALLRILQSAKPMAEEIAIYVLRYWQDVATTQAFALRNPQAFRRSISVLQQPTFSSIAKLLLLATNATETHLSESLHQNLANVAQA